MSNKTKLQENNSELDQIKSVANALPSAVPKTGGTMTGALILHADPVENMQAATKHYVDSAINQVVVSMANVG